MRKPLGHYIALSELLRLYAHLAYSALMRFEWDEAKRRGNLRKHGVDFPDAVAVLEDPNNRTFEDPDAEDEVRYITLGMSVSLTLLIVVWTERTRDIIRIISARPASKGEAHQYYK